ncbi:Htur_1727 family rSAM-partnered candidate RiPP [Natrinema caseinilyticum]|uniref:Htur_1727 family rSAM-partnered candidate RiPP n=1 Tax=Natrinema caseinilyticum TaxID=2961570 RepID=UPI0020C45DDA|nr:Htur_1727 family rSAM-partnered candidate RiPP [Natrinema caseinilyticum]
MGEKTRRSHVASDGRGNPTPQWEVFVRDEASDPMRHVGSVAAASGTEAHEHASRLFDRDAVDVWLCPAEAVDRYSTRGLADAADDRRDGIAGDEGGGDTVDEGTRADERRGDPRTDDEPTAHSEARNA